LIWQKIMLLIWRKFKTWRWRQILFDVCFLYLNRFKLKFLHLSFKIKSKYYYEFYEDT
jgi:hypothetical protein